MAWGAIAAAGISALGSLLFSGVGSGMQFGLNKGLINHQAKTNYKYAEKYAKEGPAWNRAGLEAAGYNPMNAVQNSTSGANSSWASGSSVSNPDLASAISTGIANVQSFQRLKNETDQAESQIDKNYAEADEAKARKAQLEIENEQLPERIRKEIAKTSAETSLIETQNHQIDELLRLREKELSIQGYNATTSRRIYELDKQIQDIIRDREERYKEWGKNHPYLRNVDETISRYFNGVGLSGSGNLSKSHLIK